MAELKRWAYQTKNADYVSAYASAMACRSGFSAPAFFTDAVDKIKASNDKFLNSLASLESSRISDSSDDSFQSLREAIDKLLYAGGVSAPSYEEREGVFGEEMAKELSIQAFYMILTQMGRYFYLYGNTDNSGKKGSGDSSSTNDCLADYQNFTNKWNENIRADMSADGRSIPPSQRFTFEGIIGEVMDDPSADALSPCNTDDDGHPELKNSRPRRKARMCEGIVLLNNFFDILPEITFQGNNSGDLSDLKEKLSEFCTNEIFKLGSLCEQKNQSNCEKNENIEAIETYFVFVFGANADRQGLI